MSEGRIQIPDQHNTLECIPIIQIFGNFFSSDIMEILPDHLSLQNYSMYYAKYIFYVLLQKYSMYYVWFRFE